VQAYLPHPEDLAGMHGLEAGELLSLKLQGWAGDLLHGGGLCGVAQADEIAFCWLHEWGREFIYPMPRSACPPGPLEDHPTIPGGREARMHRWQRPQA